MKRLSISYNLIYLFILLFYKKLFLLQFDYYCFNINIFLFIFLLSYYFFNTSISFYHSILFKANIHSIYFWFHSSYFIIESIIDWINIYHDISLNADILCCYRIIPLYICYWYLRCSLLFYRLIRYWVLWIIAKVLWFIAMLLLL